MRGGKSDVVISPGGPVGPRWFGGRLGCHLGGRPVTSRFAAASDQEQAQDPVATPRRAQGLCRSRRTANPTVSVVVPTLNEARNLAYAFRRLPPCVAEVVVVDGRSTDDTVAVARALRPDVKVVLERARGKGAALRAGFAAATGDIIVMTRARTKTMAMSRESSGVTVDSNGGWGVVVGTECPRCRPSCSTVR